jgi:septum formation protein
LNNPVKTKSWINKLTLEQQIDARLVLASSSPYRRVLLERLQLPFVTARPDTDETPLPDEGAAATAARLSQLKARAVAPLYSAHLIIGSDQVAECESVRLDKPLRHEVAKQQLSLLSGREAQFHTAVTLLNSATGSIQTQVVPTRVRFRRLSEADIARYLQREPALDCAGSAKSEGLGIALIEAIHSQDPAALIGLPLIALCAMLRGEGVLIP